MHKHNLQTPLPTPDHPEFIGGTRAIKTVIEEREARRQAAAAAAAAAGPAEAPPGSGGGRKGAAEARQARPRGAARLAGGLRETGGGDGRGAGRVQARTHGGACGAAPGLRVERAASLGRSPPSPGRPLSSLTRARAARSAPGPAGRAHLEGQVRGHAARRPRAARRRRAARDRLGGAVGAQGAARSGGRRRRRRRLGRHYPRQVRGPGRRASDARGKEPRGAPAAAAGRWEGGPAPRLAAAAGFRRRAALMRVAGGRSLLHAWQGGVEAAGAALGTCARRPSPRPPQTPPCSPAAPDAPAAPVSARRAPATTTAGAAAARPASTARSRSSSSSSSRALRGAAAWGPAGLPGSARWGRAPAPRCRGRAGAAASGPRGALTHGRTQTHRPAPRRAAPFPRTAAGSAG
jgi:hypothetical protein